MQYQLSAERNKIVSLYSFIYIGCSLIFFVDTCASSNSSLALLSSNQQQGGAISSSGAKKNTAPASVDFQYGEKLSSISRFATYGALFRSTAAIHLTEEETEYTVSCIKHIFDKHIVFQFDCTNTLNDQVLENVHMMMQPNSDKGEGEVVGLIQVADIPADRLEYGVTQSLYVAFEQQDPDDELATQVVFSNTLVFQVKDCDPTTGEADPEGYDDEYQVEAVEVATNDYIRPDYIEDYEALLDQNQVVETFALDKDKAPSLKGMYKWETALCVACIHSVSSCLYISGQSFGHATSGRH